MTFATYQTGDEVCGLCGSKCRQTYPMTHYDKTLKHFRPVRACVACLGPTESSARGLWTRLDLSFPKGRAVALDE
jgi:hypothetical protein